MGINESNGTDESNGTEVRSLVSGEQEWYASWLRMTRKKNPAAVALGKRRAATAKPGELAALSAANAASGGHARARKLSARQRKAIAKKAAAARWAKKATK